MNSHPPLPPSLRWRLTVTVSSEEDDHNGDGASWLATVELPDGSLRTFKSPFELARFVAEGPPRTGADPRGGLR